MSAFAHFGTGCLEDAAFAIGEALDALGGDFVEDGIDFFAEEFFRRQFFFDHRFVAAPTGFLGMDFDEATDGRVSAAIELRPLKMPVDGIFDKDEASQNAAKVSHIGDVLAKKASVREDNAPSREPCTKPKQVFGAHGNDHEEQQNLVGK